METDFNDGTITKLDNVTLEDYTYKIMKDNTVEERMEHLKNNKLCHGFTESGEMKFYIDPTKIIPAEGKYLIVHNERNDERINKNSKTKIPKKVHFVYLSKGKPFGILYYIAVKAVMHHCSGYEIHLHTDAEPDYANNIYLRKLKDSIVVDIVDEPKYLNGNQIHSFQHKADYIRLNALKLHGGIYLDLDIILLKSLDHFLNNQFIMGYERSEEADYICNAVIMCEPQSMIIDEWIEIYNQSWGANFIPSWMGHSVVIPAKLKRKYAEIMTIYPPKTFYPFLWTDFSILFDTDNKETYENSYAVHLWDTEASKTGLLPMDLNYFAVKKNAFVRLFGYLINDLFDEHNNNKEYDIKATYGSSVTKINVGKQILSHFRTCNRIIIPKNSDFNNYFGDPCPNVIKHLFLEINGEKYTIGEKRSIDLSFDLD